MLKLLGYVDGGGAKGNRNDATVDGKPPLLKMPGDKPWTSAELSAHIFEYLRLVKVKAGGEVALAALADKAENANRQGCCVVFQFIFTH